MISNNGIEDTVICIDDSNYMRNEDIVPNRLLTEQDSINIICHHILSSRVENRVSLLTIADNPQLIQSLTNNEINVMRKLYAIAIKGEVNLKNGILLALLVLKHNQQNHNRRKRMIVFVGSPVKEDPKQLEILAKKVIKSNVSLDIVSFGPENEVKNEILKNFVTKVGKDSHLVIVPKNRQMANVLADSPLLSNSRSVSLVNENVDPELSLAMKMSAEENRNKFDDDLKRALEESTFISKSQTSKSEPNSDQNLEKAIALSLEFMKNNNIPIKDHKLQEKSSKQNPNNVSKNMQTMSEAEQLALSLQMSLLQKQRQSKESAIALNHKKESKTSDQVKDKKPKNQKKNNKFNE